MSVILTTRNCAAFLDQTLSSLRNQTWTSWELIVVDSGSSDGTLEESNLAADADPRMRVYSRPGFSRGGALNEAISKARGSLIANTDCDDPSHPHRLEVQVRLMEADSSIGVLSTATLRFDGPRPPAWRGQSRGAAVTDEVIDQTPLLRRFNPITHSSIMVRADVLRSVGGYDQRLQSGEDYDLMIRIAAAGYRVVQTVAQLASHRLHGRQVFEGPISSRKRVERICTSLRIQMTALHRLPGPKSDYALLLARGAWAFLPRTVRLRLNQGLRKGFS